MNDVPTVNRALLTLTDALANPVIVVLPAANVVMPDTAPGNVAVPLLANVVVNAPATNEMFAAPPVTSPVTDSVLENVTAPVTCNVVDTLANPVIVVLPAASVVIPDTGPLNVPVLADNTQRWVELPSNIVFDEGVKLVPDITKLPDKVLESVF